jgi:hypothetical protein
MCVGISKKLVEEVKSEYKEKLLEKYDYLCINSRELIKQYLPDRDDLIVIISADQMTDVVLNYFVDVHRFKQRRDMTDANKFISAGKIAAFTVKWIVKLKPLMVQCPNNIDADVRFISRYINEIFAVAHAEDILNKKFPDKLIAELVFDFRQKKLSETQLYMTFEQIIGFYDNR